jgi:hypothetical protein
MYELGSKAKLAKHGRHHPRDGLDFGGRKDALDVDPETALLKQIEYEEELERQIENSIN